MSSPPPPSTISPPPTPSSTLYPKIHKPSDFVYAAKLLTPPPLTLSLVGTTKLHGTHADIVLTSSLSSSTEIRLQSRNQTSLAPGKNDNSGFAAFALPLRAQILELGRRIVARYEALNPGVVVEISEESPLVIAGEWCGKGIQKGVALTQLERCFVIVSLWVNGGWVLDENYKGVCDEAVGVYNISRAGYFHFSFDLEDADGSERAVQALADKVERACPFARTFGIEGMGEGIVWKAREYCGDPAFWFKTKGDALAVSQSNKVPPSAVAMENRHRAENFAKAVVTENRLMQGWEYMGEMGMERGLKGMGGFLGWVVQDCLAEEEGEMRKVGISKTVLKPAIVGIAKGWFERKVAGEARGG